MIPRRLFWLSDVAALCAAFAAAYLAVPLVLPALGAWIAAVAQSAPALAGYFLPPGGEGGLPPPSHFIWVLVVFALASPVTLSAAGAYADLTRLSRTRIAFSSLLAGLASLSLASLLVFALRLQSTSRLFLFLFGAFAVVAFAGARFLVRAYANQRLRAGYYTQNVLLVGAQASVTRLAQQIARGSRPGEYRVMGYLGAGGGDVGARASASGDPPRLGVAGDLPAMLVRQEVDAVIAVHPTSESGWLERVIAACDDVGLPLSIVPEPLLLRRPVNLRARAPQSLDRLPAVGLAPYHWNPDQVFIKRVIDILVSALLLAALSPLFGLLALAIRLTSSGPVLYRWRVVGQRGRPFTGYKFSTMVENADDLKPQLERLNEMSGPVFKMKNDPRVTPLGRFLRKYSLNELPQLWSVLKGDMSLVGPRPAFRHELERYEFWQKRKLSIRPGITCLWQVCGRNQVRNFDDWVKMDLEYIDNWSLWLDFKILLRTVWAVIAGTGS